ncbi:MAG TPA: deoxyribonuclease V [Rhodocyclaceae bacterium]|nr:deoxyribonuclease V [Rhodocyclaceae bacterium]
MTPAEAIALQKNLATRIELTDRLGDIRHIAGVDVGFEAAGTVTRAAVAVLDADSLQLVDHAIARRPTEFPYIPGLLSFREIPAILDALGSLRIRPDLLLVDGQGIAHPRRIGIASHLGLLVDLPSIGVGKSRLTGKHGPVPEGRGEWTPLVDKGETIGAVLRSRVGVAPLYISPGYRICLETSLHWVMHALTRYRLPETTRWAHRLASGPALSPKK